MEKENPVRPAVCDCASGDHLAAVWRKWTAPVLVGSGGSR